MVKDKRPVNLNLLTIRQPVTAVLSILHRITGLVLFLSLPLIFWALSTALAGPEGFNQVAGSMASPVGKVLVLLLWAVVTFHLCAGLRHTIMDMGWGETLSGSRFGALLVMVLTVALVILGGIWLW
jgi:succinate dehydrogenase / fumarate reductase, cytochrome b subunit